MNTKAAYLAALREELDVHPWAKADPAKADRYVDVARAALAGEGPGFEVAGGAGVRAWWRVGGEGKPTLAKLKALPDRAPA